MRTTNKVEDIAERVRDNTSAGSIDKIEESHWMSFSCTCIAIHENKPIFICTFFICFTDDAVNDLFASFLEDILWPLTSIENIVKFIQPMFQRCFDLYLLLVDILDLIRLRGRVVFRFELDKDLDEERYTLSLLGWWRVWGEWCRWGVFLRSSMSWDLLCLRGRGD